MIKIREENTPDIIAYMKERLSYDPSSGDFTWVLPPCNWVKKGSVAGTLCHGYVEIRLHRVRYGAHRLAFLWVHGRWPSRFIDHIDGNPGNNRISNLRECTELENAHNARISKTNTTGFVGVTRCRHREGSYYVRINVNRKHLYIGTYHDINEAAAAYAEAKARYHPFNPVVRGQKSFAAINAKDVTP